MWAINQTPITNKRHPVVSKPLANPPRRSSGNVTDAKPTLVHWVPISNLYYTKRINLAEVWRCVKVCAYIFWLLDTRSHIHMHAPRQPVCGVEGEEKCGLIWCRSFAAFRVAQPAGGKGHAGTRARGPLIRLGMWLITAAGSGGKGRQTTGKGETCVCRYKLGLHDTLRLRGRLMVDNAILRATTPPSYAFRRVYTNRRTIKKVSANRIYVYRAT